MFSYILYCFVLSSCLHHLRIFFLRIDWICLLCSFRENHLLYTAFLNPWVGLQGRIISTKYKHSRTNFSRLECSFSWGKWRYGVWDILLCQNIREGKGWTKELFDISGKYLLNLVQCCILEWVWVTLWHNAMTLT